MGHTQGSLFNDEPASPAKKGKHDEKQVTEAQTIKRLHDFFNERRGGRPLKLTPERRVKYRARLKTFTPRELARAIDNALHDPFYAGDNKTGTRYDYPEIVLKNDAAVDRHLDRSRRRDRVLDRAARWMRALDR